MIKLKMNKIISSLEKEINNLENQIEIFINKSELKDESFVRNEDLLYYFKLIGKKIFLNDCINNIKCSFIPGEDLYEQDKEDYGQGFDSYYEGQLESFDLYLAIVKSVS